MDIIEKLKELEEYDDDTLETQIEDLKDDEKFIELYEYTKEKLKSQYQGIRDRKDGFFSAIKNYINSPFHKLEKFGYISYLFCREIYNRTMDRTNI